MIALVILSIAGATADQRLLEQAIAERFEAVGRTAPQTDQALTAAATVLARLAFDRGPAAATDILTVAQAVSSAGGADPTPRVFLVRGPLAELMATVRGEARLTQERVTHVGVAIFAEGTTASACVLTTRRRAQVEPYPRQLTLAKGPKACFRLGDDVAQATVFITLPQGQVQQRELPKGDRACLSLPLAGSGRHTVELMARTQRGPEVVALFFVDVGPGATTPLESRETEVDDRAAPDELVRRTNLLRQALGHGPVRADPALAGIAAAYAQRMATDDYVAHVSPEGHDVRYRLAEAKYPFSTAGENLALADGALAAHFAIEHSPAHRQTILGPYQFFGAGLARRADGQLVLVELLASSGSTGLAEAPNLALEAINRRRTERGLRPLTRHAALDALAQTHAAQAAQQAKPSSHIAGQPKLTQQAFSAIPEAATAAVDVVVTQSPSAVPSTANSVRGDFEAVGVGAAWHDAKQAQVVVFIYISR